MTGSRHGGKDRAQTIRQTCLESGARRHPPVSARAWSQPAPAGAQLTEKFLLATSGIRRSFAVTEYGWMMMQVLMNMAGADRTSFTSHVGSSRKLRKSAHRKMAPTAGVKGMPASFSAPAKQNGSQSRHMHSQMHHMPIPRMQISCSGALQQAHATL